MNRADQAAASGDPIPKGLAVHRTDRELAVRWTWLRPSFHGRQWFVALVTITAFVVTLVRDPFPDAEWVLVMFVPLSIALTWPVVAGLLNSTTVVARDGWILVRHEPVPWKRNRKIACAQIVELYVDEARYAVNGKTGWHVCAVLTSHRAEPMVVGVHSFAIASYIQRVFSDYVGAKAATQARSDRGAGRIAAD